MKNISQEQSQNIEKGEKLNTREEKLGQEAKKVIEKNEREIHEGMAVFKKLAERLKGLVPKKKLAMLLMYYGMRLMAPEFAEADDKDAPPPKPLTSEQLRVALWGSDEEVAALGLVALASKPKKSNQKVTYDERGVPTIHIDLRRPKKVEKKELTEEEKLLQLFEVSNVEAEDVEIKDAPKPKEFKEMKVEPKEDK